MEFDVPVIGAPMDSVTSPATAIAMGKMGALGVLDLEGLWTRYEDPTPLLDEIAGLPADQATERIQQIYAEPVKPELITQRLHEIRAAGVTVAGALSPQRTQQFYSTVVDAGVDLFGDPRHCGLRRARLLRSGTAEPQEVHLRP